MKLTLIAALLVRLFFPLAVLSQQLQPGFDKSEYIEALKISARSTADSTYYNTLPAPDNFTKVYQSPMVSFDNLWDLWIHKNHAVAAISIRGTTEKSLSWLANFYAAMVPAQGELQISKTEKFSYHLADNPKAAVHVGWLVSTAFLSKDMLPKIDSCYRAGIKDILIIGHSQGGGIAYLLTAYLYNLQEQHVIPADIHFKTYCSAAPKPGNLYFAYDYETKTQTGWAYNVVNAADWVPEVPFSIQTVNDFNTTNPFVNAKAAIKKQKFPTNLALRHVYNKLDRPTRRAQRNYQNYLGKKTSKMVKKNLEGYIPPEYYNSNHYVRTGTTIVLSGKEDYYKLFPDSKDNIFVHHLHKPYLYLAEQLPSFGKYQSMHDTDSGLDGTWELNYISGRRIAFEGLYPNKKPTITFEVPPQKVYGNTSCNNFNSKLQMNEDQISFTNPMALTKMMCPGEGEQVFLEVLKSIDNYSTDTDTLTLKKGDIAVMRFTRK